MEKPPGPNDDLPAGAKASLDQWAAFDSEYEGNADAIMDDLAAGIAADTLDTDDIIGRMNDIISDQ